MVPEGDVLIARITNNPADATAHALLSEFQSGYPVDQLRRLLQHHDERVVRLGAWLASELGARGTPLVHDLPKLLEHRSRYVRFYVIDSILSAATTDHGEAISAAVERIGDADAAVRWKTLNFLAQASHAQLVAGLPFVPNPAIASFLKWLLDVERLSDTTKVIAALGHNEPLQRLFASAAASRLADHDRSSLRFAAASTDPEVVAFAREQLERIGANSS